MRILIADDESVSRTLLEQLLLRMGHEVTAVRDGLEAIQIAADPDGPRLVILDWMMPGADGLTVCRTLRRQVGPYTYVILLTSRDGRDDLVEAFDAEVDDFLPKPCDPVELKARLRSGERVLALQERLLSTQEALRHEATHDRLTGLWNRASVLERLDQECERARRGSGDVSIVMVDVDHFKSINDRFGHLAGDRVLRQTASCLAHVPRSYDMVGRYGGEEFLILLPETDLAAASAIAERARVTVENMRADVGEDGIRVTISLGVASATGEVEAMALLQRADEALYQAKRNGRNCTVASP